jgi:ESS family glutamate:Na+ symporter
MLMDFALMSVLLVAAMLLRSRVKLLQDFLIPAPLLAGFLGLAGGVQGLNVLPFARSPNGDLLLTSYPAQLVVVLFATLFLGARPKGPGLRGVVRQVGDTFFYNLAAEVGQFGAALAFGLLVLAPLFPQLPAGFALMLPAGFAGGHGTANVVGTALEKGGWSEAITVGYTFATIGLLAGLFGGVLLINVGARLGWTRLVRSPEKLPEVERRGFVAAERQTSLGRQTVSPAALDPLTWHVGLALIPFAAAHLVDHFARNALPGNFTLPLFAVAMLAGAGVQKALDAVKLGQYVDRQVMGRIASCVSDYLIGFGVVSIRLDVVRHHAGPILVMTLFGLAYCVLLFWFVGRRVCRTFWFERSLFVYGWATGVVATSVTLLRVVDPRLRSRTLEDYGLAYLFIAPVEIAVLVVVPAAVAHGWVAVPAVVLLVLFAVCLVLSAHLIGWFRVPATAVREGEQEIIEADSNRC